MFAVAVGFVEGFSELVADQQGEVGVFAAEGRVRVAVAVDGVDALHVLRHYMAIGVHAEGAHTVPILLGPVDQLGLIDHVGDMFKHLGGQLHPHTDVHLVVDQVDAQPFALPGEPLRPGAPRRGDEGGAVQRLAVCQGQAVALPCRVNVLYGGAEPEVDMLLPQVLIQPLQDFQVVFRPQVLALGLEQVQVVLQRPFFQGTGCRAVGGEALCRRAELHVDFVHIADEVHDLPGGHIVRQPAAKGGGEVEFAVREGPRAAEAAHGGADGAVDAPVHLPGHNGAAAGVDVLALVQHQDAQLRAEFFQLVTGEGSGLAAADDDNVVTGGFVHLVSSTGAPKGSRPERCHVLCCSRPLFTVIAHCTLLIAHSAA